MPNNKLKKWKTTKSEYLVRDRWIRLRADSCKTPEGHTIEPFYVLEYPDWISCVVLSEDLQEVTMLQHYRHGIDDFVPEIPGGNIDEGESPEQAVARELKEELGLEGATIHKIGQVYANPHMMTNIDHCFVALGGTYGKPSLGIGENFEVVKMPFGKLLDNISQQKTVYQSLHVAAIFLALNFLKKQGYKLPQ